MSTSDKIEGTNPVIDSTPKAKKIAPPRWFVGSERHFRGAENLTVNLEGWTERSKRAPEMWIGGQHDGRDKGEHLGTYVTTIFERDDYTIDAVEVGFHNGVQFKPAIWRDAPEGQRHFVKAKHGGLEINLQMYEDTGDIRHGNYRVEVRLRQVQYFNRQGVYVRTIYAYLVNLHRLPAGTESAYRLTLENADFTSPEGAITVLGADQERIVIAPLPVAS